MIGFFQNSSVAGRISHPGGLPDVSERIDEPTATVENSIADELQMVDAIESLEEITSQSRPVGPSKEDASHSIEVNSCNPTVVSDAISVMLGNRDRNNECLSTAPESNSTGAIAGGHHQQSHRPENGTATSEPLCAPGPLLDQASVIDRCATQRTCPFNNSIDIANLPASSLMPVCTELQADEDSATATEERRPLWPDGAPSDTEFSGDDIDVLRDIEGILSQSQIVVPSANGRCAQESSASAEGNHAVAMENSIESVPSCAWLIRPGSVSGDETSEKRPSVAPDNSEVVCLLGISSSTAMNAAPPDQKVPCTEDYLLYECRFSWLCMSRMTVKLSTIPRT